MSLMVTADHPVPVEPAGGIATVTVLSGDTIYYSDNPQVSASNNQGSIAAGASRTFTGFGWIRSAGLSAVSVLTSPSLTASQTVIMPSGDTTGQADTTSIQTAINAVQGGYPNQGGTVTLGPGVFTVNSTLTIQADNITIEGAGLGNPAGNKNTNSNPQYGGTVLVASSSFTGSYVLKFGLPGTPTRTLSGCFLRNVSIDCQNAPASVSGVFWQAFKGGGEHVYVSKPTSHGFVLDGNGSFTFPNGAWDNHFFDWTSDTAGGNGWVLQNFATDNAFVECTSKFPTGDGWNIDANSVSNRWTGGYVYNCGGKCINSATMMQLKFIGLRLQDSNGGIYLAGAGTIGGSIINGCTFRNMSFTADNTTDAINLAASAVTSGVGISGCDFAVDQGSGNGTTNSWNRPRYLINISQGNVKGVVVSPYDTASTRTDGTFYGTSAINDLGTNTVIAYAIGGSGLPELKHSGNVRFLYRSGSPAGAVSAQPGSVCVNTAGGAGTTLFVKESASDATGWVGK